MAIRFAANHILSLDQLPLMAKRTSNIGLIKKKPSRAKKPF